MFLLDQPGQKVHRKNKFVICNACKNDTHNPNLLRVGDTFSLTLNKSLNKKITK